MIDGLEIRVRGQVQGVGFRPFIWALANELGLHGAVLNDPEGVLIRASGARVGELADRIGSEAPPLARVDAVEPRDVVFDALPNGFIIAASEGSGSQTRVTPDAATCPDCLREVIDEDDRRHGYPFANCTNCGPRFTIIHDMPYDRAHTTMAAFDLCEDCAREYADPADRRFHAQPVACAVCGPRLWVEVDGMEIEGDPIAEAASRLKAGQILAIKGLGGFHLACDARNEAALNLLRHRKRRPTKPFALMGTMPTIRESCAVSEAEEAHLCDAAAPIVVLEARGAALPSAVAPGQTTLGWMLPYTPMHHLILRAFGGPLVMTSGNLSGEPQVIGNQEARDKLSGFADAFVMHDREIARRLDDSVERITGLGPMVLRRARGRVPETIALPKGFESAPQIVAYGGQMKGALCLIKNGSALLGHHLGDLDDLLTYEAFLQADQDYRAVFDHAPDLAACDLHPDFAASRHAQASGLPVETVQHHHAHMASCLGENGWPLDGGKVAGIILDGTGLGPDGTVWGGELLLGDYRGFERHAWLAPAPLPGGDAANREPWRNLFARLPDHPEIQSLLADKPLDILRGAMARGLNAPLSSSAGRLFDAVAALLFADGAAQSFEGEFAMRLEAHARGGTPRELPPSSTEAGAIEVGAMFEALVAARSDVNAAALGFHMWLAEAFARPAHALVTSGQAEAVVLSGGCFQNALLLELTVAALGDVPVLMHHTTPANDGGLALGQALVAAARAVETS